MSERDGRKFHRWERGERKGGGGVERCLRPGCNVSRVVTTKGQVLAYWFGDDESDQAPSCAGRRA